ncbi:PDDEXK nuclease domain-containing protein [Lunatimonas salinarum]|uniref:PDDEXK nuclease domain-containing protein n=1 Tax=Lunatimonas salinarum TaxID=1774590 RepID=UPI001ADF072C|nr:PDDEXK nuclease domain-containing protein [Lunatimonas salinarum]
MNLLSPEYKKWLVELKGKIRSAQIKAAIAVNSTLILFYWELGEMISEKQTAYGTGFIPQLSKDLQDEFPEIKGLSARNLAFCRQFYQFYTSSNLQQVVANLKSQAGFSAEKQGVTQSQGAQNESIIILKQLVAKIPWGLGKGFAFIGQQFHLQVGESDYYIDLLFYHTRLKCYVVIELKNTKFIPEFAGKLNFYLSAVDSLVKDPSDNPTIGILLCKDKNNVEVEFALRDLNKPMGVSELKLVEDLPENLKSSLPTIEEIEVEFDKIK